MKFDQVTLGLFVWGAGTFISWLGLLLIFTVGTKPHAAHLQKILDTQQNIIAANERELVALRETVEIYQRMFSLDTLLVRDAATTLEPKKGK